LTNIISKSKYISNVYNDSLMKNKLSNFILRREGVLYLSSFIIAYFLTLLVYFTLNTIFDRDLKQIFTSETHRDNGGELFENLQLLSRKYHLLSDTTVWSNDGNEASKGANFAKFDTIWKNPSNNLPTLDSIIKLRNILIYNSADIYVFNEAKSDFFLPYIAEPTVSVNDVMDKLRFPKLKTFFGENGADNVMNSFQEDLSDLLDEMQSQSVYKKRRYLNGSIQFITFLVALIGIMLLIATLTIVSLEKGAMQNAINSFDLPNNIDNYQIGQLEESLVKLKKQQAENFSQLREMVINTVTTFNWRGKEEAEATLNIEVQELRESMESRLGMIKYFAWAVPSIGFIGTVIGISNALGGAHKVIGQTSDFQTKGEIQLITGQLGIAFDTTLVALLLSILLVFLIHIISRKEEQLISKAVSGLKRDLLQKIAPLERANKLRRFNLLLESLKNHTTPAELQSIPFVNLKNHLEDELNSKIN